MQVIHILADGTEVEDITDHVIALQDNDDFYHVVNNLLTNKKEVSV